MLKKLELDSLTAQLAATREVVARAKEVGDIVTAQQLGADVDVLQHRITELGNVRDVLASVTLFFAGDPVVGSRGVDADFAGSALHRFQALVSKQFAAGEIGQMGARGPVPANRASELMVTEIARGSFGFLLEESALNNELFETKLSAAVDDVAQLMGALASPSEAAFEESVADLEPRVLGAAKAFFETLDDANASLRIVERDVDYSLSTVDVHRARQRAEAMEITERDDVELTGLLRGIVPDHRKFEFTTTEGQRLYGSVAANVAKAIDDNIQSGLNNPTGKRWRARFKVREVQARNAEPKTYYTLLGLLEELPAVGPSQ
jgi:hypothetical protein